MNDQGAETTSVKNVLPPMLTEGQIYLKRGTFAGDMHLMLSQVEDSKYCLIGLADGNRWRNPMTLKEMRVMIKEDDIEYVADKLTSFTVTSRTYTEREMTVVV